MFANCLRLKPALPNLVHHCNQRSWPKASAIETYFLFLILTFYSPPTIPRRFCANDSPLLVFFSADKFFVTDNITSTSVSLDLLSFQTSGCWSTQEMQDFDIALIKHQGYVDHKTEWNDHHSIPKFLIVFLWCVTVKLYFPFHISLTALAMEPCISLQIRFWIL